MKKIAFYIESLIVGGAEKVLIDLVNHLDYSKYDVSVIAIFKQSVYDGYSCQFEEVFRPEVHYITLVDNSAAWKYRLFNRAYAHLNKGLIYSFLIKEQYDIEVAFYEGLPTEFVANSTNHHSKKYAWLHTDNTRLHEYKAKNELAETEQIYLKYEAVVGVSNQVVKSFNHFFPNITTRVIYNLLDTEMIAEKVKEECSISSGSITTFLTVGRLIEIKGYLRLIGALAKLKAEGFQFRLIMVGEGNQRAEIEKTIRELGLEQSVVLAGMQTNPYRYMRESDYFICSSFAEGLSTVVMESIVCGLPVITTDCSGMADIFGDCICGSICENSKEGLYLALKNVLQNPTVRLKMVDACRKRRESFTVEKRIKEYDKLFLGE